MDLPDPETPPLPKKTSSEDSVPASPTFRPLERVWARTHSELLDCSIAFMEGVDEALYSTLSRGLPEETKGRTDPQLLRIIWYDSIERTLTCACEVGARERY